MSTLTCIAGVSGSGKSTLVNHIIYEGLSGYSKSFTGSVKADKAYEEVILVDQTTVSKRQIESYTLHRWVEPN